MKNTYNTYLEAVKHRRTYYSIAGKPPVDDAEIEEIVKNALLYTPSAFNSQSGRVVLLLGGHHAKLWSIVMETLRSAASPERFAVTQKKINGFAAGYGTLLIYEDQSVVKGLQAKYPLYADNFPVWSMQASGMLQVILWTMLEEAGLGVSLQHYNPLIDAQTASAFGVPADWMLIAQMPFGAITGGTEEKTFVPLEERMMVRK